MKKRPTREDLKIPYSLEDPAWVAHAIGVPLDRWPGQCFGIASMIASMVTDATAVYGAYRGKVAKGTLFDRPAHKMLGCTQHGWIITPAAIIDPTRFVFEGKEPYIYFCALGNPEYDEGSNVLREQMLKPPPAYEPDDAPMKRLMPLDLPAPVRAHLDGLFGDTEGFTAERVFWIANLPLRLLAEHAKPIYAAITAAGEEAFIPWDNRQTVMRG